MCLLDDNFDEKYAKKAEEEDVVVVVVNDIDGEIY